MTKPRDMLKDGSLAGANVPSEKQKIAGNYEKGHTVLHGMRISVENAAGTERKGKDETGRDWTQRLAHSYAYLRGSTGKDKDHIDVFLGPEAENAELPVHVVDQVNKAGEFDEHKALIGWPDADSAALAYHENYEPGWGGFKAVTSMPLKDFKGWAYNGAKRKPVSELAAFKQQPSTEPHANDFKNGGRVDLASGGGVGTQSVGLGTYATGDQSQAAQPTGWGGVPAGVSSGSTSPGVGGLGWSNNNITAPMLDANPFGYIGALASVGGGQGYVANGAGALDPSLVMNANNGWYAEHPDSYGQSLSDLAGQVGIDPSAYDLSGNLRYAQERVRALSPAQQAAASAATGVKPGADDLRSAIDNQYSNIWNVGGMAGDNPNDPRDYSNTLYQLNGSTLSPISNTRHQHQADQAAGPKASVAELISALSVALPAFGGWAGILGNGAAGTLTAGGGLGLTGGATAALGSTATNALVNAGMSTALSGGNVGAGLGSLAGAGGGALGQVAGEALGAGYGAIGQQLGSQLGRYAYNQSRQG